MSETVTGNRRFLVICHIKTPQGVALESGDVCRKRRSAYVRYTKNLGRATFGDNKIGWMPCVNLPQMLRSAQRLYK